MNPDDTVIFPILTVDGIVFQLMDSKLAVLLIERGFEPFKNKWALPGGYNPAGETTRQALDRVMGQKTGVCIKQLNLLEQIYTFDTIGRDPRGHAVSVVYMGLGRGLTPGVGGEVQNPQFHTVDSLPKLAYDHGKLITFARDRLKQMVMSTNAISALLPKEFTLSQLQGAYEAVLGTQLDKRNFRKKILALGFLAETDNISQGGAHRPARLYAFKNTQLQSIAGL